VQVTFVEALDQLMPGFDPEIGKLAQRILVNPRKIDYHTGVFAKKVPQPFPPLNSHNCAFVLVLSSGNWEKLLIFPFLFFNVCRLHQQRMENLFRSSLLMLKQRNRKILLRWLPLFFPISDDRLLLLIQPSTLVIALLVLSVLACTGINAELHL